MSTANILLRITAEDLSRAGLSGLGNSLRTLSYGFLDLNTQVGNTGYTLGQAVGALSGASVAFLAFYGGLKSATTQGADLEFALAQMNIAISDGSQYAPQLQQAVIDIGNASIFTHTQVSQVFQALGEMGYTAPQILAGVGQAAVNMSIAMGVDGVTGAKLLGQSLQVYNANAQDASTYSDMLTRSFYDSGVGADGLQQAISQAGGEAHVMGISFQDFMTTTDLLARSMGSGSKAGTSLRYMLSALNKPTATQAEELSRIGIVTAQSTNPAINQLTELVLGTSAAAAKANGQWDGSVKGLENIYKAGQAAGKINLDTSFSDWATSSGALNDKLYDSQGHFLGLKNALDQIQKGLKGMSPQQIQEVMASLFNVRGGQGAEQLVGLLGQFDTKYNQIYADLGKTGTAQSDANKLLNTAQGRWQQLGTTMNSFMSQVGTPINNVLKNIYLWVNNLVSSLSNNSTAKEFTTIFLVVGTVLAGVTLIVIALTVAILTGLLPIIVAAVAVFAGIIAAALIITAVIMGIIYVVQHWGQITKWVQEQFHRLFTWLGEQWKKLTNTIHVHLVQLGEWFKEGFGKVQTVVHNAIAFVGHLFLWLYNHNTYIKELVDLVVAKFTWLHDRAVYIWNLLTAAIHLAIMEVHVRIVYVLALIHAKWEQAWNWVRDKVTGIWNAITGFIGGLASTIGNAVYNGVIAPIQNAITSMVNAATKWGENFVGNIVQGIKNKAGEFLTVIKGMAGGLAKYLGFHSPTEEGPGRDADTWAPNFIRMFALGLANGAGTVHAASQLLSSSLKAGLMPSAAATAGLAATASQTVLAGAAPMASQSGTVVIPIQLGSKEIGRFVLDTVHNTLKMSGAARLGR